MTTAQLDLVLRFFVESPDRYHKLDNVVMFVRQHERERADPSLIILCVMKLVRERFVDYRKEELYTGEPDTIFNVSKSYHEDFMITYDGVQFYNEGGFKTYEERKRLKTELEERKFKTELEFIEQSKKMIPFQRKQSWITVIVSLVSLIFIAITTYQGCSDKQAPDHKPVKIDVRDSLNKRTSQEIKGSFPQ